MARHQQFSRHRSGGNPQSPRGYGQSGGSHEPQWQANRSGYFGEMGDERNFGGNPQGQQDFQQGNSPWDEDRYAYPEATSYGREMSRGSSGYRPQGRFGGGNEQQDFGQNSSRHASRGGEHFGGRASWAGSAGYSGYGEAGGGYGQGEYGGWGSQERGSFGAQAGYGNPSSGQGAAQRHGQPSGIGQQRPRGQTPKGYTRSDDRIKDDVCECLYRMDDVEVGEVSVEVKNGTVTLTGTVPERRMKHSIEDACEQCIGVTEVENRIRVSRGDADTGGEDQKDRTAAASRRGSSADARH